MIYNDALGKIFDLHVARVNVNGDLLYVIPDDTFTPDEIEDLRNVDEWSLESGQGPWFANFLPDDVRPAGIKKM